MSEVILTPNERLAGVLRDFDDNGFVSWKQSVIDGAFFT